MNKNVILIGLFIFLATGCFNPFGGKGLSFYPVKPVVLAGDWYPLWKSREYRAIWMNEDNTKGWAVGDGVYRFVGGLWSKDEDASALIKGKTLYSISGGAGDEVWAAGDGIILHYTNGHWRKDKEGSELTEGHKLTSIAWHPGETLFSVGDSIVLHYSHGRWMKDVQGTNLALRMHFAAIAFQDGENAYAVGVGIIFHCKNGVWEELKFDSGVVGGQFYAIAFQPDGTGWAVGFDAVVHFFGGKWHLDEQAMALARFVDLRSVAMGNNGEVWAAGRGTLLHYANGSWDKQKPGPAMINHRDDACVYATSSGVVWVSNKDQILRGQDGNWETDTSGSSISEGHELLHMVLAPDGTGWAVGSGIILHETNGKWKKDIQGSTILGDHALTTIVFLADGTAWAGGESVILHYHDGRWEQDLEGVARMEGNDISEMALQDDGTGWAVGDGILLRHHKDRWEKDMQGLGQVGKHQLTSVTLAADGTAWAAGPGILLHHVDGRWRSDSSLDDARLYTVLGQRDGTVWASGEKGVYFYEKGVWQEDAAAGHFLGHNILLSFYEQPDGSLWAVGTNHLILKYSNERWTRIAGGVGEQVDPAKMREENIFFSILCKDKDDSWVADMAGTIYQLEMRKVTTVQVDQLQNLEQLDGSVRFTFPGPVSDLHLSMTPADDTSRDLISNSEYGMSFEHGDSTVLVAFSGHAKKALSLLSEKNASFRLEVLLNRDLDIWQELVSSSFPVSGLPWWQKVLKGAIGTGILVLLLNVAFLLLAIPFPWFRRNIFGDEFNSLLQLFSVKGLVTKPLLLWIRPIRMALLADYRKKRPSGLELAKWKNPGSYTFPRIDGVEEENSIDGVWRKIAGQGEIDGMRPLWLIGGQSGLGKTALLEQLAIKAFEMGRTAILIRLGSTQSMGEAIKEAFGYFGQLKVDAKTAEEMAVGGGFFILLDGLNEARDRDSVRSFVKSVLRTNTVVVSSQIDPKWEIMRQDISLRAFGKKQFLALLADDRQVDQLLRASYLFDINRDNEPSILPFTAKLVIKYIKGNSGRIPPTRLSIYSDLVGRLRSYPSYINLEKKAWDLFVDSGQDIEPGTDTDNIEEALLEEARENDVMTRVAVNGVTHYRFGHEKIFRFFVAAYLHKQYAPSSLPALHEKLTKGQDRLYWADVLEFWGEFISEEDLRSKEVIARYKYLILEAGRFERRIVVERLLGQWERFCVYSPELADDGFSRQLLGIIKTGGE